MVVGTMVQGPLHSRWNGASVSIFSWLKMSINSEYLVGTKLPSSAIVLSSSMHAPSVNVSPSQSLREECSERVMQEVWYRSPGRWILSMVDRSPFVTQRATRRH
jgi:hypothetical protein